MSWQIWAHCTCVVIQKNKVPGELNDAGHTHRAGDSLLRSTGYEKNLGIQDCYQLNRISQLNTVAKSGSVQQQVLLNSSNGKIGCAAVERLE